MVPRKAVLQCVLRLIRRYNRFLCRNLLEGRVLSADGCVFTQLCVRAKF